MSVGREVFIPNTTAAADFKHNSSVLMWEFDYMVLKFLSLSKDA